jgi:2-amino-4-hydroxy-6-hydroxymethyldihydropteridine diphosphokinase
MTTAYLSIGSNEGDRMGNLERAVELLAEIPETHVETVSSVYETEPAYDQDQRAFYNAVVEIETDLEADDLLGYAREIEDELGRVRERENGPRTIDVDIVLFGDEEWATPDLTIPHPMASERDFVLTPLLEIAPDVTWPDGTPVTKYAVKVGMVKSVVGAFEDPGEDENQPLLADDWIVVAEGATDQDVAAGWDAGLQLKKQVLEEEGIPYAFDPYEPGSDMDPFGLPTKFKLLVPADREQEAMLLLAAVEAAPPIYPDDLGEEPEEPEDPDDI